MNLSASKPCAVITGAGSGIGRAIALILAKSEWQVVLVGRRPKALLETATLAIQPTIEPEVFPCDVSDQTAVDAMATSVIARFGCVQALINAAGINTPQRALAVLTTADFRRIVETNLYG